MNELVLLRINQIQLFNSLKENGRWTTTEAKGVLGVRGKTLEENRILNQPGEDFWCWRTSGEKSCYCEGLEESTSNKYDRKWRDKCSIGMLQCAGEFHATVLCVQRKK
jgi:hypothetical protein